MSGLRRIVDAAITQLGYINGTGDYHNRLDNSQIKKGYKAPMTNEPKPFICLPSAVEKIERQDVGRPASYLRSFELEIFGYLRDQTESLDKVMDLDEDMERAITSIGPLDDLTVGYWISEKGCGVFDQMGICRVVISGTYIYQESA